MSFGVPRVGIREDCRWSRLNPHTTRIVPMAIKRRWEGRIVPDRRSYTPRTVDSCIATRMARSKRWGVGARTTVFDCPSVDANASVSLTWERLSKGHPYFESSWASAGWTSHYYYCPSMVPWLRRLPAETYSASAYENYAKQVDRMTNYLV